MDRARPDGELLTGGDTTDEGLIRPTVIANPSPEAKVSCEEVFGPVVTLTRVELARRGDRARELDALRPAGRDLHRRTSKSALEAARRLEFGGVTINEAPTFRADQMPYGGVKASGNTREGPAYAVRELTEERLVVIRASERPAAHERTLLGSPRDAVALQAPAPGGRTPTASRRRRRAAATCRRRAGSGASGARCCATARSASTSSAAWCSRCTGRTTFRQDVLHEQAAAIVALEERVREVDRLLAARTSRARSGVRCSRCGTPLHSGAALLPVLRAGAPGLRTDVTECPRCGAPDAGGEYCLTCGSPLRAPTRSERLRERLASESTLDGARRARPRGARSARRDRRVSRRLDRADGRRDEPARPDDGPHRSSGARHADRAGDDRAGDDDGAGPDPPAPTSTTLTEWTFPDGYTLVLASVPAGQRPRDRRQVAKRALVAGAAVGRHPRFEGLRRAAPGLFRRLQRRLPVQRRGLRSTSPRRSRGLLGGLRAPGHALTAAGVAARKRGSDGECAETPRWHERQRKSGLCNRPSISVCSLAAALGARFTPF